MLWLRQFSWWSFLLIIVWVHKTETSHSKIIDVHNYLRMESSMISKGRNYLLQERNRLKLLETSSKVWEKWRKSYLKQENEYTTIPQNIFHLFKKLILDLDQIETTMMENSYNNTMIPDTFKLPTSSHLKQVVLSLVALQNFYNLKSIEIMNGKFMDIQLDTSLTIDSNHFIAETCLEYNKHLCACNWLKLWLSESPKDPHRRKKVFRSLYPSYIFLDKKELAYNYTMKYLKEDPYEISANDAAFDLGFTLGKLKNRDMDYLETNRLCRGDYDTRVHTVRSNLRCRYKKGDSAFLKIAPLKEEDLYDNPKILLYRDVIHDSEIERMKASAAELLKTAMVHQNDGKSHIRVFKFRVCEVGYMDNRSPDFTTLSERIEDISDLSIESGERWQLLSYSFGGHFSMHNDYDYVLKPEDFVYYGNRVASMLFYFNEVILGGETVFPRIGLAVKPIKGAAMIWYSVYGDGSRNPMVEHSGCPVIIGEKWGFTQFFRSRNQISLRRIFDDDSTTSSESIKILRKLCTKTQGN